MERKPDIAQVIARMTRFAANTKDDMLSVKVSRAAQRLMNQPGVNVSGYTLPDAKPLTAHELAIIRPFLKERELQAV